MNNTILILSSENDWPINSVVDWINYLGYNTIRVSEINLNLPSEIEISTDDKVKKINININYSKIKSVWLRRPPFFNFHNNFLKEKISIDFIEQEKRAFKMFFHSALRHGAKVLGSSAQYIDPYYLSKLECLIIAKKCNILTPPTLITTSKESLVDFIRNHGKSIFKPLSDPVFVPLNEEVYAMYTQIINLEMVEKLSSHVFPVFIQKYIEKKFEVRAFFMNGTFFSAAIFSQNDPMTSIDYRNYNVKKENRVVPFLLPETIQNKIKRIFKHFGMNTGSIDLIYSTSEKFYFLEINPVGQFGMVSSPCNYYLDKKIAAFLVS